MTTDELIERLYKQAEAELWGKSDTQRVIEAHSPELSCIEIAQSARVEPSKCRKLLFQCGLSCTTLAARVLALRHKVSELENEIAILKGGKNHG